MSILLIRSGVARLRQFHTSANWCSEKIVPKLSPYDVNLILRENEFTQEYAESGSIKSYDSNQLASNSPVEDTRCEAICALTQGHLIGVYDGHAGQACAQVIAKRLARYVAASLVPPDTLRQHLDSGEKSTSFVKCHNDKVEFVPEIRDIYERSFQQYAKELCQEDNSITGGGSNDINSNNSGGGGFQMATTLENAFLRLDDDMAKEALDKSNSRTLSVAMSGAVACLAHVDGPHLHVASTGDCVAVLGTVTDTGQWQAKKMTREHNADNMAEVRRLMGEHPPNERDTVIRGERLLGQLMPLRAFGDFRYKWSKDILMNVVAPQYGEQVIPPHYLTPPYLTARPEVTYHTLTPRDRFLVLATDGLWDMISPMQVVKLVGEHMSGKAFLQPLKLPKRDVLLGEISQMLTHRKAGFSSKPQDKNAATHLLRNALGGTEYGIEHSKIAHMLSLPQDIVRLFRDDITITVVYFDQEFLRHCPA